jgi:uncharacterized protein (TIGR02118 family)
VSKRLLFLKRRPTIEVGMFGAALTEATLGDRVLHLTHPSGYRVHDPVYDAVVETWDDGPSLDPDLVDEEASGSLDVEEVVIVDGAIPKNGVTMFAFLNRLPGTDRAAFQQYWRDHHGPIAGRVPGLRRYVQNRVTGDEGRYDGVAQTWFDDLDAMRASAGSAELARTRADEPNFMVSGRLPFVVCTPVR